MQKSVLRHKAREVFKLTTEQELKKYSSLLCEDLKQALLSYNFRTIGVYMPLADEPNILPLYRDWELEGKELYLPRVVSDDQIYFYRYRHGDVLDNCNKYGIKEPYSSQEAFPVALDVLILPAVHYYKSYRLGRGKGYYDRYLSKFRPKLSIGITYGLISGEAFEINAWDEPVDIVLKPILNE